MELKLAINIISWKLISWRKISADDPISFTKDIKPWLKETRLCFLKDHLVDWWAISNGEFLCWTHDAVEVSQSLRGKEELIMLSLITEISLWFLNILGEDFYHPVFWFSFERIMMIICVNNLNFRRFEAALLQKWVLKMTSTTIYSKVS